MAGPHFGNMDIDVGDALSRSTMTPRVKTRRITKIRIWAATWLMVAAAKILGCGVEFKGDDAEAAWGSR